MGTDEESHLFHYWYIKYRALAKLVNTSLAYTKIDRLCFNLIDIKPLALHSSQLVDDAIMQIVSIVRIYM